MSMYPLEPGDAEAAFAAGTAAAAQYQDHCQSLITGLGSPGGDPLPGNTEWQPEPGAQVSVT